MLFGCLLDAIISLLQFRICITQLAVKSCSLCLKFLFNELIERICLFSNLLLGFLLDAALNLLQFLIKLSKFRKRIIQFNANSCSLLLKFFVVGFVKLIHCTFDFKNLLLSFFIYLLQFLVKPRSFHSRIIKLADKS